MHGCETPRGPGLRSGGHGAGGSQGQVPTPTGWVTSLWWEMGPQGTRGLLCTWSFVCVCVHARKHLHTDVS